MASAVSFVGIIAVGQTLLLVAGEFDLSVGTTPGSSPMVSARLMTKGGLPVAVSLILGVLGTGVGLGLVNGLLVVEARHSRLHRHARACSTWPTG